MADGVRCFGERSGRGSRLLARRPCVGSSWCRYGRGGCAARLFDRSCDAAWWRGRLRLFATVKVALTGSSGKPGAKVQADDGRYAIYIAAAQFNAFG